MKTIQAEDLIDLLVEAAKEDAVGTTTGHARLAGLGLRCGYYPASRRHHFWTYQSENSGPIGKAEAVAYVRGLLPMNVPGKDIPR